MSDDEPSRSQQGHAEADSGAPSGEIGGASGCRCGAGLHPTDEQRCGAGHLLPGNRAALVTGEWSGRFWREVEASRRETRRALLTQRGHTEAEAPPALVLAADGAAQATILRDAAYLRMVESGGPLTESHRARRSFTVWLQCSDRVERLLRLIGLESAPKRVPTVHDLVHDDEAGR